MPKGVQIADWNGQVLPEIKKQLEDFRRQGFPPTLRGMFYTLVDRMVIPKTEAAYHALSDHTSRWRENGKLPRDCFADHTRGIIQDFNDEYEIAEQYVDRGIRHLSLAKHNYKKTVPRWYGQPHYVEVWLEKDAAVETFRSILRDRHVRVVPNRGHSSVAFLSKNVDRLKEKQMEGRTIHILYFGDLDPSGEVMDKVYKRKFDEYGLFNVDFQRMAVTSSQLEKFGLLKNPDPVTLKKLKKDSNRQAFKLKYNLKSDDELFAVQLEAMQTPQVRSYLKRLVLDSVDQFFSQYIFERVQSDVEIVPTPAKINGLVRTRLLSFLEQLNSETEKEDDEEF